MRLYPILFMVLSILGSLGTTPAFSTPSLNGPTGLVVMPTAEILQYKEFNVAYDIVSQTNASGTQTNSSQYKVNLATFKNWEFGFVGGAVPTEGVFINAKYSLMADNERFPMMLAIGFSNLTSKDLTKLYLVGSKIFPNGLHAHLGFQAEFTAQEVNPVLMAGVEYWFTPAFSTQVDIMGAKRQFSTNAAVLYTMSKDVTIRAAWLDITASSGSAYSLGLSFGQFL